MSMWIEVPAQTSGRVRLRRFNFNPMLNNNRRTPSSANSTMRAPLNSAGFNCKSGHQIPDQRRQADLAGCKAQGKSNDNRN